MISFCEYQQTIKIVSYFDTSSKLDITPKKIQNTRGFFDIKLRKNEATGEGGSRRSLPSLGTFNNIFSFKKIVRGYDYSCSKCERTNDKIYIPLVLLFYSSKFPSPAVLTVKISLFLYKYVVYIVSSTIFVAKAVVSRFFRSRCGV
jgi:hypothetical protein